jgi:hypothetical protein
MLNVRYEPGDRPGNDVDLRESKVDCVLSLEEKNEEHMGEELII